MTSFTNVPKQVEELLEQFDGTLSRRKLMSPGPHFNLLSWAGPPQIPQ